MLEKIDLLIINTRIFATNSEFFKDVNNGFSTEPNHKLVLLTINLYFKFNQR